jgi:hypothetical protein
VPKAADYGTAARPRARWMDLGAVPGETPVYETLPGAAVYNMICVNCHGPDADSKGRQAVTLQELTGGKGRVANFRDGLFGPFGDGGAHRQRVFGSDDVAMRYLPWMALGGTRTQIPSLILNLVSATQVLGVSRPQAPPVVNANMLETARALCTSIVRRGNGRSFEPELLNTSGGSDTLHKGSSLILANGDAELWGALCTYDNPAPIHAISVTMTGAPPKPALFLYSDYFDAAAYPAATPVGNVTGGLDSALLPGNDFPWCIQQPTDQDQAAFVEASRTSDGKRLPICPAALLSDEHRWSSNETTTPKLDAFATRGAINAGWAVFYYLDAMISQGHARVPAYNECELLAEAATP